MPERIRSDADIDAALAALAAMDPRLARAREAVAAVPLRLQPAGLAGLLRIVAGQQLSTRSAAAVYARVSEALAPLDAPAILNAGHEGLCAAGLSRQKARTFTAVAEAVAAGLDLEALADAPADEARATLEAIRGIGRWSADLYLMFCAGHPDIFPVGDLAVRRAMVRAFALDETLKPDALAAIAADWAPHRSTAARLMWAYYRIPEAGTATGETTRRPTLPAGFPL